MNLGGPIILFWGMVTLMNGNLGYQVEGEAFKPIAQLAGNTTIGWAFIVVGFDSIFNNIILKKIRRLTHFISSRIKTEKLGYKPSEEEEDL